MGGDLSGFSLNRYRRYRARTVSTIFLLTNLSIDQFRHTLLEAQGRNVVLLKCRSVGERPPHHDGLLRGTVLRSYPSVLANQARSTASVVVPSTRKVRRYRFWLFESEMIAGLLFTRLRRCASPSCQGAHS